MRKDDHAKRPIDPDAIRLRGYRWLRTRVQLPANTDSRMRWAAALYDLLEPADQRRLVVRSLKAKLASRQAWRDEGYDEANNPVVRELTESIHGLRRDWVLHDVRLSADDLVAVSREAIERKEQLLREWELLGHDTEVIDALRLEIEAAQKLLTTRLERS